MAGHCFCAAAVHSSLLGENVTQRFKTVAQTRYHLCSHAVINVSVKMSSAIAHKLVVTLTTRLVIIVEVRKNKANKNKENLCSGFSPSLKKMACIN